jgi:type II secretory pathway component HofQ
MTPTNKRKSTATETIEKNTTSLTLIVVVVAVGVILLSPCLRAQRPPGVTLNLEDVDIRQFLRFAHDLTGVNVIIAPDVRGKVTAVMHDVPWEQALAAVLKTSGLVGVRDGNILRVMTAAGAKQEQQQRRQLQRANETAAPLDVCTYHLKNADARDTAGILRSFLSPRGRIAALTNTNTLIVSDVPQVLESLGITPVPPSRGRCVQTRSQW